MDNMGVSQLPSADEVHRQMVEKQQELQRLSQLRSHLLQQNQYASSSDLLQHGNHHVEPSSLSPSVAANNGNASHHHNGASGSGSRPMPRSKSTRGHTSPATDRSGQSVKRPRVMSHQYSPAPAVPLNMARSSSSRSGKSIPFVANGPVAPLQKSQSSQGFTHAHAIERFGQPQGDRSSAQVYGSGLQQQSSCQQGPELSPVGEGSQFPDVGMNPADFLAAYDDDFPSPTLVPPPRQNFLAPYDANRQSISSQMTSACPSMTSAASAAETTPLTRENSSFDNQLTSAFEMTRIESTQSYPTDFTDDIHNLHQRPSAMKQDDLFAYTGTSLPTPNSQQYGSSFPNEQFLPHGATGMERSISSTSAASAQSNVERRAREARQRQIQNAQKANLAPKPIAASTDSPSQPAKKEGKVAVAKNGSYTRPKHPKAFCNLCNEHPEGFRGDHELKRHTMAKHEGVVKKFVCRDPRTVGIRSNVQAVNPLSKCKQCNSKKQYNAYYNAAAHLRRTHFKPKTPRGKHKRGVDDEEKRGGKGGGDWPPMNELKQWFEEIHVPVADAAAMEDEDEGESMEASMPPMGYSQSMGGDMYNVPNAEYSMMPELGLDTNISPDQSALMSATSAPLSSASVFDFSQFAGMQSPMTGIGADLSAFLAVASNTGAPGGYHGYGDEDTQFPIEMA